VNGDGGSMTDIGQTAIFAFTAFNAVRIVSYVPQMLKIWRDRHGSEAVSLMTWVLFGLSHLSTVMYAIAVPGDYYMAAVFACNAVCCGFIVGLTMWSRSAYVRSIGCESTPV
jgi:uncharacterized protein with PQ loop repeat